MSPVKPKSFRAVLTRSGDALNWVIVTIPFDVAKLWGKRGQIRVKGEINGFAFRTSLFPTGKGTHVMIVNKKMQKGARIAPAMEAAFRLEPDLEKRGVTVPVELERALKAEKQLKRYYESFNDSMRRYLGGWVGEGKQASTREKRAEQLVERLILTMEAEREPPPILQAEFARNPVARKGWALMPRTLRRGHLMGIFYYATPEAKQRRLAKAVADMLKYAKKAEAADLADER
jgi:hypothetical protein